MRTISSASAPPLEDTWLLPQFAQDISDRANGLLFLFSALDPRTWSVEFPADLLSRPITTKGLTAPAGSAMKWVRAAPAAYEPRTALGKRLWEIRARIVASGEPLLDWEGVARELADRRGELESGQ